MKHKLKKEDLTKVASARIPKELHTALKVCCVTIGTPIDKILVEIIELYLQEKQSDS